MNNDLDAGLSVVTGSLVAMLRSVSRSDACSVADAELLSLGFEWQAAVAAAALAEQEWQAAVAAAEQEYRAAHNDPSRAAELAERDCSGPMLNANDRASALADAILAAPVSTVSGLVVKAAVVSHELDFNYEDDEGEPACRVARALVDSVLSLAKSPTAPGAAVAA